MFQLWVESIQQPWLLGLLIMLGTYILEDAAIVSAALLSADGMIAPEFAFVALYGGIASGDLGLYGIGILLKKWRWLIRWIDTNKVKTAGVWLKRRMTSTVLLVRIVPGLRLPTYLACGFFRLSFFYFLLLVCLATLIWTGTLFLGFYWFGATFWSELSPWKWLLLPMLFVGILFGRKTVMSKDAITRKLR